MKKSNKNLTLGRFCAILKLSELVKKSNDLPSFVLLELDFAAKNGTSRAFVEPGCTAGSCLQANRGMQNSLSYLQEVQLWLFHLSVESG